jgi:hypothetical protein
MPVQVRFVHILAGAMSHDSRAPLSLSVGEEHQRGRRGSKLLLGCIAVHAVNRLP